MEREENGKCLSKLWREGREYNTEGQGAEKATLEGMWLRRDIRMQERKRPRAMLPSACPVTLTISAYLSAGGVRSSLSL